MADNYWLIPMVSFSSTAGPVGFVFSIVVAVVLIATWVILAGSRFVQGGIVEHPQRVPQLYGYTVCLFALIWGLVTFVSVVEDILSLSAPEMRGVSEFSMEPSVTSFEAFRTTYERSRQMSLPNPAQAPLDTIPEPELRRRYDALRADRIHRARYTARQEIITGTLSFLIASGLFLFHWRWLRRRSAA